MNLRDELCVCFHVTGRKVATFVRLNDPKVASQCSECYGAGTGCGWCVPFIQKIFEQVKAGEDEPIVDMDPEEYRERRGQYLRQLRSSRVRDDAGLADAIDDEENPEQ
ncbi:MAG: (2Fe-2S)-binding protein [Sumerlaeia bacterium]